MPFLGGISVHPDGRRPAFIGGYDKNADLWVMMKRGRDKVRSESLENNKSIITGGDCRIVAGASLCT